MVYTTAAAKQLYEALGLTQKMMKLGLYYDYENSRSSHYRKSWANGLDIVRWKKSSDIQEQWRTNCPNQTPYLLGKSGVYDSKFAFLGIHLAFGFRISFIILGEEEAIKLVTDHTNPGDSALTVCEFQGSEDIVMGKPIHSYISSHEDFQLESKALNRQCHGGFKLSLFLSFRLSLVWLASVLTITILSTELPHEKGFTFDCRHRTDNQPRQLEDHGNNRLLYSQMLFCCN